jgi:hypothetical protein
VYYTASVKRRNRRVGSFLVTRSYAFRNSYHYTIRARTEKKKKATRNRACRLPPAPCRPHFPFCFFFFFAFLCLHYYFCSPLLSPHTHTKARERRQHQTSRHNAPWARKGKKNTRKDAHTKKKRGSRSRCRPLLRLLIWFSFACRRLRRRLASQTAVACTSAAVVCRALSLLYAAPLPTSAAALHMCRICGG